MIKLKKAKKPRGILNSTLAQQIFSTTSETTVNRIIATDYQPKMLALLLKILASTFSKISNKCPSNSLYHQSKKTVTRRSSVLMWQIFQIRECINRYYKKLIQSEVSAACTPSSSSPAVSSWSKPAPSACPPTTCPCARPASSSSRPSAGTTSSTYSGGSGSGGASTRPGVWAWIRSMRGWRGSWGGRCSRWRCSVSKRLKR